MPLANEFPVVSSNLKAGFGVFGTADPFTTGLYPNNGALNPPGSLWLIPSPSQGSIGLPTAGGYGSFLWVKYVLYKSTANPAMVAGPAPVYYTDETFTTVSGQASEATGGATGSPSNAAGWLLPNTGSVAGVGVGSAISAAILNNGGNGSYVFIGLQGFIPSCSLAVGAVTNALQASAASAFTVTATAVGTAPPNKVIGYVWGTVTSAIGDVLATVGLY
jgi:hypothetical protein